MYYFSYLNSILNFKFKLFHIFGVICFLCNKPLNVDGSFLNESRVNNLKTHIFNNYRSDTIPLKDKPLNLSLGIAFRAFNSIDQKEGMVSLNLWIRYAWNDYNLKWNRTDWNISKLTLRTDPGLDWSIWTPDIYLYNTAENPLENLKWSNAEVSSDGNVLWSRPGILQSTCSFDMTHFPYDTQTCFLKFGSWSYTGAQMILEESDTIPTVDLSNYNQNEEWTLLDVKNNINSIKYECCPDNYYDITFEVRLQRLTGYYETNIIIPTFATASLILVTLLIPWDSGERISFAVTVMLSIIVFLLILSDNLPKSNHQPLLSTMIMSLTFFALFGVFFTVLISALNNYKDNRLKGKENIDNPIVRRIFEGLKYFCKFRNKSCRKNRRTQSETNTMESPQINRETNLSAEDEFIKLTERLNNIDTEIISSSSKNKNIENTSNNTPDNISTTSSISIEERTQSYNNAVCKNTVCKNNVSISKNSICDDDSNMNNNSNENINIKVIDNNSEKSNSSLLETIHKKENINQKPRRLTIEIKKDKEETMLQEECAEIIGLIEKIYSIIFLIIFASLCITISLPRFSNGKQ